MRLVVNAALVALLVLPPAALAQMPRHGKAGPEAGMKRGDYIKAEQTQAGERAGKRFDQIDSGHKGVIDRETFIRYFEERSAKLAGSRFDRIDTDHNGVLEDSEIAAWRAAHQRMPRQRHAGMTAN